MTRVLVIDDDVGTAELLRLVLEESGFDVVVAMTERDLPRGKFDAVVTDLMGVSVYTFEDARDWVLRVGDRYPNVPVIVVTGHGAAGRDGPRLGARRVIMKPFDVDVIARAVSELVTS